MLETWFNRLLRDAFALDITGDYKPFRDVAEDALRGILLIDDTNDRDGRIDRIIKPRREVYLHCAGKAGVEPGRLALVAAHGWDIQGANRAGLVTGYVNRGDKPFPAIMQKPDVSGASLMTVVEKFLA